MSKSEEIREIVEWIDGFSAAVWLLPTNEVSDEYPAMYEEKVAPARAAWEGGRGMTYEEQLSAAKHRAERDQARQEAKGLREELETAEAEYRRHRANLDARYEKKADESRRRGQAMHGMSRLIRERNEEIKALKERIADMEPRLMPEGMEWLVEAWPRFEDGEPVHIGDEFMGKDGKTYTVQQVQFIGKCFSLYDFCDRKAQFNAFYGERVKRPAVLAADGKPLREGETVWIIEDGGPYKVTGIDPIVKEIRIKDESMELGVWVAACGLTHTKPEPSDSWERIEEDARKEACEYFAHMPCGCETSEMLDETVEKCNAAKARDLVRRCKALAGVSE
ncbi:hypothetical protein [Enorma massiliensis]|uniref:Uncharacterized protein n=1 Tax=Enorma massiliensis TaxID=1472761 RepID=A0A1Y3U990_9ACTN|nr:hypothetical protein [Enorma massiliensis]OUN43758.1 hypothetical protein B5G21_03470 [Enorma massiliensis]